jgi:queuosine biosynthesis protein QueD
MKATLQTDGGSRGNPGPAGIGFTIYNDEQVLADGGAYIGEHTNNIAEYQAMIWGLRNALVLGIDDLDIRADSELMVKQINGAYRVKNAGIKPLYETVMSLLARFKRYEFQHVFRSSNEDADHLVNEALDARGPVGRYAFAYGAAEQAEQLDLLDQLTATTDTDTPVPHTEEHITVPMPTASGYANEGDDTMAARYELTVRDHFDAAHALIGYDGPCRKLHGHTWDVDVCIAGTKLDDVGIVYDFKTLKTDLAAVLARFDHAYLNEVPPFDQMNATAENLSRFIYGDLAARLPEGISMVEVSVWESPIAKLTYREV